MPSVLVSHPHGAAVAMHVAAALDGRGWLARYATGIAAGEGSLLAGVLRGIGKRKRVVLNRILPGVRSERVCSLWWGELAGRAAGLLGSRRTRARRAYDALYVLHDALVSTVAWPRHADAVYAYEDGALRTFRRARRAGLGRLWDSPAVHWSAVEKVWVEESRTWSGAMGTRPPLEPDWKKRRKDEELELADVVFVASSFARRTLEAAGCRRPIVQVPYGYPLEVFRARAVRPDAPFTVLAVGAHDLRKGTPYLLEAWRRAGLRGARLRLVGPMRLTESFLSRYRGLFEHVPHLARMDLEREYQSADILAFPTLCDGFGIVVQEAMCCGTPVLTTPCGGGPECITDGVEGWLIPARDVEALVERLREASRNREQLWQMGVAARRRAERYAWPAAEERLAKTIADAVSSRAGAGVQYRDGRPNRHRS